MNKPRGVPEFEPATELGPEWFNNHLGHHIVEFRHTIFEGSGGVEYLECRCYLCRKVARKRVCGVLGVSKIHTKKKRKV